MYTNPITNEEISKEELEALYLRIWNRADTLNAVLNHFPTDDKKRREYAQYGAQMKNIREQLGYEPSFRRNDDQGTA